MIERPKFAAIFCNKVEREEFKKCLVPGTAVNSLKTLFGFQSEYIGDIFDLAIGKCVSCDKVNKDYRVLVRGIARRK